MVDNNKYRRRKILLIYDNLSSFVERDLGILSEDFEVIPLQYRGKKDLPKLTKEIGTSDLNISWFVLGYATSAVLLSKALRKKSIVIAGGWDVVAVPEIGYGAMLTNDRIKKTTYALKNANKVLAVSKSIKKDVLRWVDRAVEVVYLGFDPEEFKPSGEKEDLVITVANIREDTVKLKGLETLAKAACALPEYKFAIIGKHSDKSIEYLESISPKNVEFLGYLSNDKLFAYYQKAKIYAQFSYQESFGSALAEAMLCECVPVVTKRGALPEVVGDVGFYAEYGNVEETAQKIKEALRSNKGKDARQRIINNFHIDNRKERLRQIIEDLLGIQFSP